MSTATQFDPTRGKLISAWRLPFRGKLAFSGYSDIKSRRRHDFTIPIGRNRFGYRRRLGLLILTAEPHYSTWWHLGIYLDAWDSRPMLGTRPTQSISPPPETETEKAKCS